VKLRLAELLDEFEFVLINAPSVILDGTATLLGPLVDGVILVVEANSTHREVARKAKERLESANVRLLGAVFNNRTFPIPAAVYSRL
jgi:Mrp family chromosome partitioning ATPase